MTLNGVIIIILHYFAEFGSFRHVANYVEVVDQPSADFLPRNVIKYTKNMPMYVNK